MERRQIRLLNCRGQILIEALVASALMVVVMLAFAKLIELKKNKPTSFNDIKEQVEALNAK